MDERSRALDEAIEVFTQRRCQAPFTDAYARYLRSLFARPEMTFLAARDERGRPLAVTGVVIDDVACLIVYAVASSHDARWALHGHLVDVLIPGGVRYVIATDGGIFGALGLMPNVQQYQHLLGYELRHVTPVPAHPMRRNRRVLVSLAAAAVTAASLVLPSGLASAIEVRAPQALIGRTMLDAGSALVHRFEDHRSEHRHRDAG